MYYYKVAELKLKSYLRIHSFSDFICDALEADVTLDGMNEWPEGGYEQASGQIVHRRLPHGWFIHATYNNQKALYISDDYSQLRLYGQTESEIDTVAEWLVRVALECWFARRGYVSLHSAAVEVGGGAYAFSGPSGIGKSTRSLAWTEALDATLISGDRPLINARQQVLYGIPWDGKEQCFRNVHYPLQSICEVRRSASVYVRKMSYSQKRKLLLRQCFIPMWDTDTAAIQIANIAHLAAKATIVRAFSGPTSEDAKALYSALTDHYYLKEEPDMKAKPGFILRNVVDEYILMPTGDNIGRFNGTVLLNSVSAFVWEKLQNPLSREDLLQAILDEYEIDKATATDDLDALLEKLRGYDVIEDD